MKIIFLFFCLVVSVCFSQKTRPEISNFEETSRYDDVIKFVNETVNGSKDLKLDTIGRSFEGRILPMIVYGDTKDTKSETIRKSGKMVVYVQGNIHAGEVEGKEALLYLLRELKQGKHASWKKNLIVLIVPIFNADGNEKINLYNRPFQYGPIGGMGQRANAQSFDLNRDHMKLESPEVFSFVKMLNEYDPAVTIDLHTTNGSFHAYHLNYSFALNYDIDSSLDSYTRNIFFPDVQKRMTAQHWRSHYYGDYMESTATNKAGYYFWAHQPRFNSNYVGFRNRLAILSEAYSYITFEQRINATKDFVVNTLDVISSNVSIIRKTIKKADESAKNLTQYDSLGVRGDIVESNPAQKILLAPAKEERNPYTNEVMYLMNEDSIHEITTSEFYKPIATRKAKVPKRYIIPDSLKKVVELLDKHGIQYSLLPAQQSIKAQRFAIRENKQSDNEFQKHKIRTLEGSFENIETTIPVGSIVVEMNQPLSRLVFYLLEPESEDGVVAWNFVDKYFGDGKYYPIFKVVE